MLTVSVITLLPMNLRTWLSFLHFWARASLKEMWGRVLSPGPAAPQRLPSAPWPFPCFFRCIGTHCFISSSNLAGPESPCTPWPGQQMTKCRCGSDLLQNAPASDLTVPGRGAEVRGGGGVRGQRVWGGLLNQLWTVHVRMVGRGHRSPALWISSE